MDDQLADAIRAAKEALLRAEWEAAQARGNLQAACARALDSGATLREVGELLGVSRERARQIAAKASE